MCLGFVSARSAGYIMCLHWLASGCLLCAFLFKHGDDATSSMAGCTRFETTCIRVCQSVCMWAFV